MNITKREKEIIHKLAEGLTVKEVASELYLSPYTIETHKKNIYEKMKARTLVQLGAMAVRSGIIAFFMILIIVPCSSQSEFEIEGTIKATALSGNGDRNIMVNKDGILKVTQNDPAITEFKDSTGDVRMKFDANAGLLLMMADGDTIQSTFLAKKVVNEVLKSKQFGPKKIDASSIPDHIKDQYNSAKSLINSLESKIQSALNITTDIEVPNLEDLIEFQSEEFGATTDISGTTENFQGGDLIFNKSGELLLANLCQLTMFGEYCIELSFINNKLRKVEFPGFITVNFDENCNEIVKQDSSSIKTTNPTKTTSTSMDGQNIGAFNDLNPSLINAWLGIDINGLPAFAVADENNQAAIGPDFFNVFNQDGNTAQQVKTDINGIQAVRDNDITNNGDTPQVLDFKFDFDNNRILVCGDIHVKGNVTATGSIAPSQVLKNNIVTSKETFISESIGSGNVITDESGYATIEIPSFVHKNFYDFRYQLTVIGSFSNVIVSQEIHGDSFQIRSSDPHIKVSWQVNGLPSKTFLNSVAKANEMSLEPIATPKRINNPFD